MTHARAHVRTGVAQLQSESGDFAEWHELGNPREESDVMVEGSVVGFFDGKASRI